MTMPDQQTAVRARQALPIASKAASLWLLALEGPAQVRAGKASARSRWAGHIPRTVRLDALTNSQRSLVLALVAAAREEAAPEVGTGTAVVEGTRDADHAA